MDFCNLLFTQQTIFGSKYQAPHAIPPLVSYPLLLSVDTKKMLILPTSLSNVKS